MATKALFFLALTTASLASGTKRLSDSECDDVLTRWVQGLRPQLDSTLSTLVVNWTDLDFALASRGCSYDQLYLELWRVSSRQEAARPPDFASSEYFKTYERCTKLEPEHFRYQATDTHRQRGQHKNEVTVFTHVVQNEYVLRLCPCGRRRHQRVCDCEYGTAGKTHCSPLINVDPGPKAKVFPWCSLGSSSSPPVDVQVTAHSINCSRALLTGTLASCTPIQRYDRLRITLHKMISLQEVDTDNLTCSENTDFGLDSNEAVQVDTDLHPVSDGLEATSSGYGEFTLVVNLNPDAYYCVKLEHLEHPYCNRDLTIGHHMALPTVCTAHVARPIYTGLCEADGAFVAGETSSDAILYDRTFLAMFLAVITIIVLLVFVIFVSKMCRRSRASEAAHVVKKRSQSDSVPDETPSTMLVKTASKNRQVLLLYFPSTRDHDENRGRLLREWLVAANYKVSDMSDPDEDEAISTDPEGWVQQRLLRGQQQVILVASQTVAQILATNSTTTSRTTSSSVVSMNEEEEEDSDAEEVQPLTSEDMDSRHELRVYALKKVQAHLTGNYRQLVVVSYATDHSATASAVVASVLTPHKKPLVLPQHLPHLKAWLAADNSFNTTSNKSDNHLLQILPHNERSSSSSSDQYAQDLAEQRLLDAFHTCSI